MALRGGIPDLPMSGWAPPPSVLDAARDAVSTADGPGWWPEFAAEEDRSLFRIAGATRLDNIVTRPLWRWYRELFDSAVNDDKVSFASTAFTDGNKSSVALRVLTAIRRISSFTAWYDIAAAAFRRGYAAAWFAGYATVIALTMAGYLADGNSSIAIVTLIVASLAVAFVERVAVRLTRRWPFDAIACIVALGIFTVAFHDVWLFALTTILPQGILSDGIVLEILRVRVLFIAASGVAVFAAVLLLVLVLVHRFHSWVTARKLRLYPEDEIIQSLVAALGRIGKARGAWVSGGVRGKIVDDLHWIGCRFENEFLGRFARGDGTTDEWLRDVGAQLAAACRLRERIAALPERGFLERISDYASRSLMHAARSEWNLIDRVPAPPPSPKRRIADNLTDAAKIAFPAVIGIITYLASTSARHIVPEAIGQNALYTGLLASVVALWSTLDPHSDHGLGTAKTLGEMLKPPTKA
jgi:hypothetical protein